MRGWPQSHTVLKRHFPQIASLRDGQGEAIERVVGGHSTVCLMPTGAGKSLVYQVAGIRLGGTTLVISPLIALMSQQAQRLGQVEGVTAFSLSDRPGPQMYNAMRGLDFSAGPIFVFSSPERIAHDGFLTYLMRKQRGHIRQVVVDESHCVSQWGHTFRPPYKAIPSFLDAVFDKDGWPPVLCLTATLNPMDLEEVCKDFRIPREGVLRSRTLLRDNLQLRCEVQDDEEHKVQRLRELLDTHNGEKVLVYVHRKSSAHGTARLCELFKSEGRACEYFDADRDDSDKRRVLREFESGETPVVFATNAFGMGIDIRDIRVIIHYLIPESIEQYYQEVGRAGRDGLPSYCYLLFSEKNVEVRTKLIKQSILKRDEVETFFQKKCKARPGNEYRNLNPYVDLTEKDNTVGVWFALQNEGILEVVARGPSELSCFAATRRGTQGRFARYSSAHPMQLTAGISKKINMPLPDLVDDLWQLYLDEEVSLKANPAPIQFFRSPSEIPGDRMDNLLASADSVLQARLRGFEALVDMVRSTSDPTEHVRAYLHLDR